MISQPASLPIAKLSRADVKLNKAQLPMAMLRKQVATPVPTTEQTPPSSEKGVVGDDGYEYLKWPTESEQNWYRAPGTEDWKKWS